MKFDELLKAVEVSYQQGLENSLIVELTAIRESLEVYRKLYDISMKLVYDEKEVNLFFKVKLGKEVIFKKLVGTFTPDSFELLRVFKSIKLNNNEIIVAGNKSVGLPQRISLEEIGILQ